MSPRALISIGILVFSTIGSYVGELFGGGWIGIPSIIGGIVGCFAGIWIGYKLGQYL